MISYYHIQICSYSTLFILSSLASRILPDASSLNSFFLYYVNIFCNLKGISFKINKSYKSIIAADPNIIEIHVMLFLLNYKSSWQLPKYWYYFIY